MIKDKDKKKKKLSSSGMTTKDKMLARKKQLESRVMVVDWYSLKREL